MVCFGLHQIVSVHLDFVVVLRTCADRGQDHCQHRKGEKASTHRTVLEYTTQRSAPLRTDKRTTEVDRPGENSKDDAGVCQVVAMRGFDSYNDTRYMPLAVHEFDVSEK